MAGNIAKGTTLATDFASITGLIQSGIQTAGIAIIHSYHSI